MSNLLSIGKTGLLAAQVGLSTTGNNITNANVPGYSRQVTVQGTLASQNAGFGFVGSGTEVSQVKRIYDSFLATQVRAAQSTTSSLDSFYSQISQIDNLMADSSAGLSPVMQEFFKGVQDMASSPTSSASRQALLSTASSMASRFQSLSARLTEIGAGVNSQIESNVNVINSYAKEISQLNESISQLVVNESNQPNDLLDQRDQLLTELSKYVKTSVSQGDNNTVTVSIGSGQPLVIGNRSYELAAVPSNNDPNRIEVGYVTNNKILTLSDSSLNGGSLGGLLEFRSNTLDRVQNSLGRVALGIATTFNDQLALGQDQNGVAGTALFSVAPAKVGPDSNNNPTSTAKVSALVTDASALTTSDYNVKFNGADFVVKRLSDGQETTINPYPQTEPQVIDGVSYTISGTAALNDNFSVKPTVNGAATLSVVMTDITKLAAAAPVREGTTPISNKGSGKVASVSVDKNYLANPLAKGTKVEMQYSAPVPADPVNPLDKGTIAFTMPDGMPVGVTMTALDGTVTSYADGVVPYVEGAKLSFGTELALAEDDSQRFGGIDVTLGGTPGAGDKLSIEPNLGGSGDSRNAVLLGSLQDKNILIGGSTTFQGAYAETVSYVGNKTRETQISGTASAAMLAQMETAQQSVSGVNLDEEAANLLRYQQAYQASGKVMQIASQLFDVLLSLGR